MAGNVSGSKKRPALEEDDDAVTQDVESSLSDIGGRVLFASIVKNSARQDHEPGRVNICVDILEGDKIEIQASTAGYEILRHRAADGTVRRHTNFFLHKKHKFCSKCHPFA